MLPEDLLRGSKAVGCSTTVCVLPPHVIRRTPYSLQVYTVQQYVILTLIRCMVILSKDVSVVLKCFSVSGYNNFEHPASLDFSESSTWQLETETVIDQHFDALGK